MYRAESQRAARNFIEDLRSVLDKCAKDTYELKRAYNKGPLGTGAEAVSFSTSMKTDMEQIRSEMPMLEAFSKDTPRAHEMLGVAFDQLDAITRVFDRFEERLESGYGIAPVKVPAKATEEEFENDIPNISVMGIQDTCSLTAGSHQHDSKASLLITPSRKEVGAKEDVDLPIPKTPRLEDFGISNEDLRGLGMDSPRGTSSRNGSFYPNGTPQQSSRSGDASTMQDALGVNLESGDFEEIMQKSISELGIETPVQVAEKFENRRHRALTKMMVTTTPRLKSGGRERTLDYTGLAGGYYAPSGKKDSGAAETHRQLNFDETPRGRRGGDDPADSVCQQIADNYESLGFWRQKVSCETLQEAARVLCYEGNRVFEKHDLTNMLSSAMPGHSYYSIIVSLTKLKVLQMDKPQGGEATYRLI